MGLDIKNTIIGRCCSNAFLVIDCRKDKLSKEEKSTIAKENIPVFQVDSALFINDSKKANIFLEIFEKDGSESDSCGNGIILAASFLNIEKGAIEMKGGLAIVETDPLKTAILMDLKFSKIDKNIDGSYFVKMGEPHLIYFTDSIEQFDLIKVGKDQQSKFSKGINVDVIEKVNDYKYKIKTFERGVLDITKSCGTGSLSSYIAVSSLNGKIPNKIEFESEGGSHWVSVEKKMLKLETFKKFCKVEIIN